MEDGLEELKERIENIAKALRNKDFSDYPVYYTTGREPLGLRTRISNERLSGNSLPPSRDCNMARGFSSRARVSSVLNTSAWR
jgi:hypothetical protein